MRIIDKAAWHLDGGIEKELVISHFKTMFEWLDNGGLLTAEGKEIRDEELYSEASINEKVVNEDGMMFFESCYSDYISKIGFGEDIGAQILEELYQKYLGRRN